MSEANAGWDAARPSREEAKYACLDSGQGCGGGTTEHSLSGDWTATTESSGSFSGYTVKDWNLNMNAISSGHNGNHLLNANNNGANSGSGTGTNSLLALGKNDGGATKNTANFSGGEAEYHTITLPESFDYFGNTFSHLHINENGFVSFDTDTSKPYDNAGINNLSSGGNRGAFPLQYFDEAKHFTGGNSPMDGSLIPEGWGKPGTSYEGNFDNSIFALLGGYNTEDYNGESNWSIRTLWNSATKIFTVGWYNLRSGKSTENNAEVNLEIQFNMNDDSFKIVHGKFGGRFPDASTNSNSSLLNYFTGISKDLSCLTTTEDISACEGKDYIQLMYFDPYGVNDIDQWSPVQTFQNPDGNNYPNEIDTMYNSYFGQPTTSRNGTYYCYVGAGGGNLDTACGSAYNTSQAKFDVNGRMFSFTPLGSGGGSTKNVLLPSNIKQSYRSGLMAEFMWMHLDKDPTTLAYTPPANNATGFDAAGPNSRDGVTGGSLSAGSAISHTTALDEIVIAGEVYTHKKLQSFLHNNVTGYSKKVVAYAPIPLLHTNKYELQQYVGPTTSLNLDQRFRHVHTIMPQFISTDYMESKDNGTDANFDFHQLNEDNYFKGNMSAITYNTVGANFSNQHNGAAGLGASDFSESRIDGMYGYAAKVLNHNEHVASERFGDLANNADFVPVGQSLWYQVFNATGRGVGLFAQLNWSCGVVAYSCHYSQHGTDTSVAPHRSQQSLFSVLVVDSGDKSDFATSQTSSAGYSVSSTGTVIDGSHYWSYKRRDGRTTTTDGEYAGAQKAPQIAFGINPIACVSGPDNGCFFGDNQGANSSTIGAPSTAIITTSDPCSSGSATTFTGCHIDSGGTKNMELGVMYSMEANDSAVINDQKYKTATFYQGIAQQKQYDGSNYVDAINLNGSNSWRSGITTSADTWSGRFSGHMLTDVEVGASLKSMPQYFRAPLTATFDAANDRVKVIANNINIHADPDWNTGTSTGDNTWYHSGGCGFDGVSWDAGNCSSVHRLVGNTGATLQFGDDDNQKDTASFANSAYINKKVFGAILKDESKNLEVSGSSTTFATRSDIDNAGALVTWDTIDEKDKDWLNPCSAYFSTAAHCVDPEPSLEYMSWGIWAMASNDGLQYLAGEQPSAVHMGTWYAGDLLDASDWPVSRTASLAGMAMFSMWKSQTVSGVTTNYAWTEGSRAVGSVVFDGSGDYGITIEVPDLGKHTCDNGANSGSGCGSGSGAVTNNWIEGQRMGTLTWSANGTAGNPNFDAADSSASVASGVSTWKSMQGSLYGTASHVEAGAELIYSKQNADNYIQAIGTVILSE
tara:strand:- start:255 stop:4190 length:3936 start_codon:yes stop_codon:yes gene_type:complete